MLRYRAQIRPCPQDEHPVKSKQSKDQLRAFASGKSRVLLLLLLHKRRDRSRGRRGRLVAPMARRAPCSGRNTERAAPFSAHSISTCLRFLRLPAPSLRILSICGRTNSALTCPCRGKASAPPSSAAAVCMYTSSFTSSVRPHTLVA